MVEILKTTDMPLLSRKEVIAEISFDQAVPSRKDVKKALSAKLGSKEEFVVIKKIKSVSGQTTALVEANIYKSENDLKKIEPKYALQRGVPKDKQEEAPAEKKEKPTEEQKEPAKKEESTPEAKEEKPTEEKKEDPKKAPTDDKKKPAEEAKK